MKQTYEDNKRRIKAFKLTADVKDDNGVVHHFIDGYEYVEIGGVKWATCNVGAENETDGGLYFAWGDTQGYKDSNEKYFTWGDYKFGCCYGNLLKYNNDDGLATLETCDDAATVNMGSNWRVPTSNEFSSLLSATTSVWITDYQSSGVNGILFTDKTDSSKKLFFPAVGYCCNGSVRNVGSYGYYWSSSLYASDVIRGWSLYFGSGSCDMNGYGRLIGFPVRAVFGQK